MSKRNFGMIRTEDGNEFILIEDQMDWDRSETIFLEEDGSNHTGRTPTSEETQEFLAWNDFPPAPEVKQFVL